MKLLSALLLLCTALGFCRFNNSGPCTVASPPHPAPVVNHIALYVTGLTTVYQFLPPNVVGLDTIPEPFHDGRHTWFLVGPKSHLHIISGVKNAASQRKKYPSLLSPWLRWPILYRRLTRDSISPTRSWIGEKMAVHQPGRRRKTNLFPGSRMGIG